MFAFATALSKVHENFRHRAHAPLVMKEGKEKGPNLEICKQYNKLARCSDVCVRTELLFTLRPAGGLAGCRRCRKNFRSSVSVLSFSHFERSILVPVS